MSGRNVAVGGEGGAPLGRTETGRRHEETQLDSTLFCSGLNEMVTLSRAVYMTGDENNVFYTYFEEEEGGVTKMDCCAHLTANLRRANS